MRPLHCLALALFSAVAFAAAPASATLITYDAIVDMPTTFGTVGTYIEGDVVHGPFHDSWDNPGHWHPGVDVDPYIWGHGGCCSNLGLLTADSGDLLSLYSLDVRELTYAGLAEFHAYDAFGNWIGTTMVTSLDDHVVFPAEWRDLSRVEIYFLPGWFGWDNLEADTCVDADSDGLCNADDACPYDADNDLDADGVCGDIDVCPATVTDGEAGIPSRALGTNRWILDAEFPDFTHNAKWGIKGNSLGLSMAYDTGDTAGCSCAQIIDSCGYGNGQSYWGCSNAVMEAWVDGQMCEF